MFLFSEICLVHLDSRHIMDRARTAKDGCNCGTLMAGMQFFQNITSFTNTVTSLTSLPHFFFFAGHEIDLFFITCAQRKRLSTVGSKAEVR